MVLYGKKILRGDRHDLKRKQGSGEVEHSKWSKEFKKLHDEET
jgi:hypothetical protein